LTILIPVIVSTFLISLLSLVGMFVLSLSEETLHRIIRMLVSFSAGTIFGASIFDLLPEAIERVSESEVFVYVAVGFIFSMIFERFIYWYHGHDADVEASRDEAPTKGFAYLNLVGDFVHNFIDGMIIAASFFVNFQLGIASSIAVAFHELPQEMGDFGILVYAGFKPRPSLIYNYTAAFSVVIGAVFASLFLETVEPLSGLLVSFSTGAFMYLSASELVPEMNKEKNNLKAAVQVLIFILGVILIYSLGIFFHHE
jgi:zinc and cadmium transporter